MRRVMRWRYYCDFCKKSGGNTLVKHEAGCTLNPARVCGMCKVMQEVQKPMAELIAAAENGIKALDEAAEHCPACMLAAIRQSKILDQHYPDNEPAPVASELGTWNYKKSVADFWGEVNSNRREDGW